MQRRFRDQREFANLKGYYKLGYSPNTNDFFRNFAASPPVGTGLAVKVGSSEIEFQETDQAGEQSLFDSRKNQGVDALTPLSGAFSWDQTALARPVPGIAFDFRYGYSGGNPIGPPGDDGPDPFDKRTLGVGWRHTFDVRLVQDGGPNELKLITWNGGIETWTRTNLYAPLSIQHKEYRGELNQLSDGDLAWITPARLAYRFRDPTTSSSMAGRLIEIRDFNGNKVSLLWNEDEGTSPTCWTPPVAATSSTTTRRSACSPTSPSTNGG